MEKILKERREEEEVFLKIRDRKKQEHPISFTCEYDSGSYTESLYEAIIIHRADEKFRFDIMKWVHEASRRDILHYKYQLNEKLNVPPGDIFYNTDYQSRELDRFKEPEGYDCKTYSLIPAEDEDESMKGGSDSWINYT